MSADYLRGRFEGLNARVDEIHDLQEALRKKNEKIRGYRAALELNTRGRHTAYQLGVEHGKAIRPRRPRAHGPVTYRSRARAERVARRRQARQEAKALRRMHPVQKKETKA